MDNNTMVIVVAAVLAIVLVLAAWMYMSRRRRERLRERFGPEYERTLRETGDEARAEKVLEDRAKKVASFRIRILDRDEATRYREAWRRVQARFVDQPGEAVIDADRLIADVMHSRGYPATDAATRPDLLSVEHAATVEHYRAAHDIVQRGERGAADTEDLRQAMVHYQALFADLVGAEADEPPVRRRA
jgi:hypothetical protein